MSAIELLTVFQEIEEAISAINQASVQRPLRMLNKKLEDMNQGLNELLNAHKEVDKSKGVPDETPETLVLPRP